MNNPDHISESLGTIFWVKILEFLDADPGILDGKNRIKDKHLGSATLRTEKRQQKQMKHLLPTIVRKRARYLTYICMCNRLNHYGKEIKK
jgi:hypothetical protein